MEMDLDVEDPASQITQTLISKKPNHDAIDMGSKGQTKISYDETLQNQVKDALASDLGNSSSPDSVDPLKSSTSGSINSNNHNSSNSDITYHDDDKDDTGAGEDDVGFCEDDEDDTGAGEDDVGFCEDDDYVSDYDDNGDFLYENGYTGMQSQFDNVDLPPGVEAPLLWLNDRDSSGNIPAPTRTLTISDWKAKSRQLLLAVHPSLLSQVQRRK